MSLVSFIFFFQIYWFCELMKPVSELTQALYVGNTPQEAENF